MSDHPYRQDPANIDDRPETTDLVTQPDGEIVESPVAPVTTPAQAKVDAIAALTMQAYAKASELKLTPEEGKALQADFPDDAFRGGAGGNATLIYLEHAFLRDRFNEVLGLGQWVMVTRNQWKEEYKTGDGKPTVRVYAQVMLMIRGCYVAEATNEMSYFPHNPKTSYADAIQGSKTAAFRRCAADFGVGLQAYKKGWCEGWWKRQKNGVKPATAQDSTPADPQPTQAEYIAKLVKTAEAAAKQGLAAYQLFWEKTLTKNQRGWLKEDSPRLKALALASAPPKGDAFEGLADAFQGGPAPE